MLAATVAVPSWVLASLVLIPFLIALNWFYNRTFWPWIEKRLYKQMGKIFNEDPKQLKQEFGRNLPRRSHKPYHLLWIRPVEKNRH